MEVINMKENSKLPLIMGLWGAIFVWILIDNSAPGVIP